MKSGHSNLPLACSVLSGDGGRRQQHPRLSISRDQDPFTVMGAFGILVKLLRRLLLVDSIHAERLEIASSSAIAARLIGFFMASVLNADAVEKRISARGVGVGVAGRADLAGNVRGQQRERRIQI